MAKKKEIVYYNGRLMGKDLDEKTCEKLDSLIEVDREKSFIKELQHIIYELPPSDVEIIKETRSNSLVDLKKGKLENPQTVGVAYMYFAKSLVLGDSVGMGKTVEVCGLCNLLEQTMLKQGFEFRFLLLTGKNLVNQVRDEVIKFTGNYVSSVQGVKSSVSKWIKENEDGVEYSVVGSHSLIKSVDFQDYIRKYVATYGCSPFDLLIIDEAGDILTNSTTQMYEQAKFLRGMVDRCILLNATSFEKDLDMFYNQISFVDETFLPTKTAFQKDYRIMNYYGPYPTFSGKYKNAEKFRDLVRYRYFARTRKSVGATMTGCTADVVVTPLSAAQKKLLTLTSMPTMVYDCPSYFGMGVETTPETTPKLASLLDLITGRFKDERSILVYSRYKESQACIKSYLDECGIDCYILNGESPQDYRDAVIDKFKLGDFRVLITNVQKGLNFGNCNVCIFYTYDPNPNKMVQFEGRMTRTYNIENKHVVLLISRGKELNTFKKVVTERAEASDIFAGSDFSCVLSILLDENKIADLK